MKKIILLLALFASFNAMQAQRVYSLQECIDLAIENNTKTKNALIELESAKEMQKEAKMQYFPTVTAGATYFHASDYLIKKDISLSASQQQQLGTLISSLGLDPTALASLPTNYKIEALKHGTFVNLMAMQPIYAGGRITTGNKLAALQTEVRELMLQQSKDDVVKTATRYYNQLLSLYEKQKTLSAASRQLKSIHKDAENAFSAGVSLKNDLMSVELKQNEIAGDSVKLENGIRLSKLVLAQYIGHDGEQIEIDRTLEQHIAAPSTYWTDPQSALNQRAEAQLLDKNVEAAKLQTKLKQGELLPSLAIGAVGAYQDLSSENKTQLIGLATLSVPISTWWSSKAVKRQKMAERIAENEREDYRQMLVIESESAYANLDNAYKQVLIAEDAIRQSEENLRLNNDYYSVGLTQISDLLDAQTKNQQARDRYAEAITEYLNCRTDYLIATGRMAQ